MITLPSDMIPASVEVSELDFGMVLRPAQGGAVTRIDRPGNRHAAKVRMPPMVADRARVLLARLKRARREGLRLPYPLVGESQGVPGAPVVDGAVSGGTSLPVRALTAYYTAKEGYWLHVIDADGTRYLHSLAATVSADAAGEATLTLNEMLRAPLADGSAVGLSAPTIEGLVTGDLSWPLSPGGLTVVEFVLEEVA